MEKSEKSIDIKRTKKMQNQFKTNRENQVDWSLKKTPLFTLCFSIYPGMDKNTLNIGAITQRQTWFAYVWKAKRWYKSNCSLHLKFRVNSSHERFENPTAETESPRRESWWHHAFCLWDRKEELMKVKRIRLVFGFDLWSEFDGKCFPCFSFFMSPGEDRTPKGDEGEEKRK